MNTTPEIVQQLNVSVYLALRCVWCVWCVVCACVCGRILSLLGPFCLDKHQGRVECVHLPPSSSVGLHNFPNKFQPLSPCGDSDPFSSLSTMIHGFSDSRYILRSRLSSLSASALCVGSIESGKVTLCRGTVLFSEACCDCIAYKYIAEIRR